jgi:hypothetical protein
MGRDIHPGLTAAAGIASLSGVAERAAFDDSIADFGAVAERVVGRQGMHDGFGFLAVVGAGIVVQVIPGVAIHRCQGFGGMAQAVRVERRCVGGWADVTRHPSPPHLPAHP